MRPAVHLLIVTAYYLYWAVVNASLPVSRCERSEADSTRAMPAQSPWAHPRAVGVVAAFSPRACSLSGGEFLAGTLLSVTAMPTSIEKPPLAPILVPTYG